MAAGRRSLVRRRTSRSDFGAPIDRFIGKQPSHLREILEELRRLIETAAPDAQSSLKWGMPCFTVAGRMLCMLGGHTEHVNLVLVGPEGTFVDPQGRLAGHGRGGRHLQLRSLAELPRASVRKWLRAAVQYARSQEKTP